MYTSYSKLEVKSSKSWRNNIRGLFCLSILTDVSRQFKLFAWKNNAMAEDKILFWRPIIALDCLEQKNKNEIIRVERQHFIMALPLLVMAIDIFSCSSSFPQIFNVNKFCSFWIAIFFICLVITKVDLTGDDQHENWWHHSQQRGIYFFGYILPQVLTQFLWSLLRLENAVLLLCLVGVEKNWKNLLMLSRSHLTQERIATNIP